MNWIKYTEAFPVQKDSPILEYIFVTDGTNIWKTSKGSCVSENKTGIMTHWMTIPNPPEKENHKCSLSQGEDLVCEEINGILQLSASNGSYRMEFIVNFCPICGFTKDKK